MKNIIYRGLRKLRIFDNWINKIESRMEIIYPGDTDNIIKNTEREIIKIIVLGMALLSVISFSGRISIIYIFMAATMMYIISKNMIYNRLNKLEQKLLKQFHRFLQDVRFQFKYDGMIDEAIMEALQVAETEMLLHGNILYDCLNNSDNVEKKEYTDIAPNHFFMTFYAMCETVKNYGDKEKDGKSLFLLNLSFLMDDVNNELMKREKIDALFMGLIGVTIIPLLGIKPITIWGISNVSGLGEYYYGFIGELVNLIIIIFTVMIANIITTLKYSISYDNQKSDLVVYLLEKNWIEKRVMEIIKSRYKHYYEMENFLKSIVYKYNVKELIVHRFLVTFFSGLISAVIMLSICLNNVNFMGKIIAFLIFALTLVIAYNYEIVLLKIREKLLKLDREEEIVRFQTIIMILMNMDRVTREVILFWMERFAYVFKNTIENISDSLIYKGNEIFVEAKEKVDFLPFERLMDNFIASDMIGINRAFSDVISDREYYISKHRQDNEIIIANKAMIAKFIAFIPICSIIIFVLIIPFVYVGLQQLTNSGMQF